MVIGEHNMLAVISVLTNKCDFFFRFLFFYFDVKQHIFKVIAKVREKIIIGPHVMPILYLLYTHWPLYRYNLLVPGWTPFWLQSFLNSSLHRFVVP